MVHILKFTAFAGDHILDVTADPDTQADDLDRLAELARNASPKTRARLEHTIAVVAHARQIRSMTLMIIQQVHSTDEERCTLTCLRCGG
jgi:hypothetical protein